MANRKPVRRTTKRPSVTQPPARRTSSNPSGGAKAPRGDVLKCEVCGLSVVVEDTCGCTDLCDVANCDASTAPGRRRR